MSAKSQRARKARHHRVRSKISGTAVRPRLNVFRSLNHIYVQVIDDVEGNTLASASTIDKEVVELLAGKSKKEQAGIVGEVVADRANKVGITEVVFDRGGYLYHGRVKTLAESARKGGLKF